MQTFNQYAKANIRIDEDNNGLFALVPDQSGTWAKVRCVESKKSVYCSHCSCSTFSKKQTCNHIALVQNYWNKIYKIETPVVEEAPKVAKVRKPRNGLVRKVRGGGLVKVATPSPVAKVIEQAVSATVPAPKVTDISQKGSLYSNKGFSLMR